MRSPRARSRVMTAAAKPEDGVVGGGDRRLLVGDRDDGGDRPE